MKSPSTLSRKILNVATKSWFVATLIGQILFVVYITIAYGGRAMSGSIQEWSDLTIKGHVAGDAAGNFMFATHLIFGVILTLGGLLQLIPWIRKNTLKFHKINGRIFIFAAILMSIGGLYLAWIREAVLSSNGRFAISINAILVIVFSIITIQTARSKKMISHRKWALRTFMVVNSVWFFRIGFMAWILYHQEAKWSTDNLDGPFDLVWAYACYLLPLAILELYFYTEKLRSSISTNLMSILIFISTLVILAGTFGSYLMMWGPSM